MEMDTTFLGEGLTNKYMFDVMHKLKSRIFKSVFSSDNVPNSIIATANDDHPATLIINYSKKQEIGTHFAAIYINKKFVVFMDSAAVDPNIWMPHFCKQVRKVGKKIRLLFDFRLQASSSTFCGIYSMLFCVLADHKRFPCKKKLKNFHYTRDMTEKEREENDRIALFNFKTVIWNN